MVTHPDKIAIMFNRNQGEFSDRKDESFKYHLKRLSKKIKFGTNYSEPFWYGSTSNLVKYKIDSFLHDIVSGKKRSVMIEY